MELRQLLTEVEARNAVLDALSQKVEEWQEKLALPMNEADKQAIETDIQNVRRFIKNTFQIELQTASALFNEFGRMTGFLSQIVPDLTEG